MGKVPQEAADFTVDWMQSCLKKAGYTAPVTGCHAIDSDIPGQTAEIILVDVDYDSDDPGLPRRLVAKVTTRNQVVLDQVIANYDQYRREAAFYTEFATPGISVPECLYAYHDPASQTFLLLMRDLAPAESPSWAASPEQVETALKALPALHAHWWNSPVLREKGWLVQFDNEPFYAAAFNAANQASTALSRMYEAPDLTQAVMARLHEKRQACLDFIASRPFTLVHGDYHAKQMFFETADGGAFTVIDWQFPFVAPGSWDFARMQSMCLATADRQRTDKALRASYLKGLADHGVDYSEDEFAVDYRFGLIVSQMIMSIAAADTDPEIFRVECDALGLDWRDVMFDRTQRAMEEWNVLELLESL